MVSIEELSREHENFVAEAQNKINKLDKKDAEYFAFSIFCRKNVRYSMNEVKINFTEIEMAYAFVKLLKDIHSLKFPQMIIEYAETRGFRPMNLLTEINDNGMCGKAIDLGLHMYGLKYNDSYFTEIIFRHREPKKTTEQSTGAFVKILNIKVDENGNPKIYPCSWSDIVLCLGMKPWVKS